MAIASYNTKRTFNTGNGSALHSAAASSRAIYTFNGTTLSADLTTSTAHDLFTNTCAVGEMIYFAPFTTTNAIYVTVGTPRNGTVTLVWEYYKWDGVLPQTGHGVWTPFTPTDASNGFQNTGERKITLPVDSMPGWSCTNFIPYTGDGLTATQSTQGKLIRCRVTASSGVTEGGATNAAWQWDDNTININGPYTSGTATGAIAGYANIASCSRTSNVATITTKTPHGYTVGQYVVIAGVPYYGATAFTGQTVIASTPTTTSFTFASVGEDGTATPLMGTAIANNVTSISRTSNVVTVTTAANHNLAIGEPVIVGNVSVYVATGGAVRASNVVTITTSAATAHGYSTGQSIIVGGVGYAGATSFNGTFTITVTSATTFTYTQTGENGTSTSGGTCNLTNINGTYLVASVPSATTFTYYRQGENCTGAFGSAYCIDGMLNSGASWTAGALTDRYIITTGGTGSGQKRKITGNGATGLTISLPWTTRPDATTTYRITNNMADIKAADTAGSWGVVTQDNRIFTIKANIRQDATGDWSGVSETWNIGSEDRGYLWTNAAGSYTITGELDLTDPDRTKNGCIINYYNSGTDYSYMQGNIWMLGGYARIFYYHGWYSIGTDNLFQNMILQPFQGVIGGKAVYRRVTVLNIALNAATYVFTTPDSVWDDVYFSNSMFALDPGYHPTISGSTAVRNPGNTWTSSAASTANQVKYSAATLINTAIIERDLWTVAMTNPMLGTDRFFKWTADLNVKTGTTNTAGVNVEIRNALGYVDTWTNSGAFVAAETIENLSLPGMVSAGATRLSNVVTLTFSSAHNMNVGQSFQVVSVPYGGATAFNGTFTVASIPSATTLTYAQTGEDGTSTAGVGGNIWPGWGDTRFNVSNGALFSVNDYIKIDSEVMKITNIATNFLTVDRAQFGTKHAAHNMNSSTTLPIYKLVTTVQTDASGNIPQQLLLEVDYYWFGTNTPAPYNTGVLSALTLTPYTFKLRKYGLVFQTNPTAITAKYVGGSVMSTNPYVVANEATAAAYTGIAIDGVAKTITVSGTRSVQELYDYTQAWAATASNLQYDEPILTDGTVFTLASGWSIIVSGSLTGLTDEISGTLTVSGTGFFEDRKGAKWAVAGSTYYGTHFTYTALDGATPKQYVQVSHIQTDGTNRTYNTSRTLVDAIETNSSGVAEGYAVWKINSTSYASQYLRAREYSYVATEGSKNLDGLPIVENIPLVADGMVSAAKATAGGYTGIAINYTTPAITVTATHTIQKVYDYQKYNHCLAAQMVKQNQPMSSTNGTVFTLYTNWGLVVGASGNVTEVAKTIAYLGTGALTCSSGGIFEDATIARWEASGSQYYASHFYHQVIKSSDSSNIVGAIVAYIEDGGTDKTYSTSRVAGGFVTDASGLAEGYAVYRINSTSYSSQKLQIGEYDHDWIVVPKTIAGSPIGSAASKETIRMSNATDKTLTKANALSVSGITVTGASKLVDLNHDDLTDVNDNLKARQTRADVIETGVKGFMNYYAYGKLLSKDGNNYAGKSDWLYNNYKHTETANFKTGIISFDTPGVITLDAENATLRFTTAGTYDFRTTTLAGTSTLTNTSGGAVTVKIYPGTLYTNTGPNITVEESIGITINISGMTAGSRYQLYDVTNATELTNAVTTTGTEALSFVYTAPYTARLRVMKVGYRFYEVTFAVTATGASVIAAPVVDNVYNTNGINGSTVTECAISGTTLRIYVDDPDNTTTWQRVYNWFQYYLTTAAGIADQSNYITSTDAAYYTLAVGFKIKNQDTVNPLAITGAVATPVTGAATDIIDATGGSIIANTAHATVVTGGSGGGATAEEVRIEMDANSQIAKDAKQAKLNTF